MKILDEWTVPADWCCRNARTPDGENWQMANYVYVKEDKQDEVLAMARLLGLREPMEITSSIVPLKIGPKTKKLCLHLKHVGSGIVPGWDDEQKK